MKFFPDTLPRTLIITSQFLKSFFCKFSHIPSYLSESASHLTRTTYVYKFNRSMGEKISHSSDFLAHHLRSSQNRSLFKPGLLKCFGVSLSDSEKKKKKEHKQEHVVEERKFKTFQPSEKFSWSVAQILPLIIVRNRAGFLSSKFSSQGIS